LGPRASLGHLIGSQSQPGSFGWVPEPAWVIWLGPRASLGHLVGSQSQPASFEHANNLLSCQEENNDFHDTSATTLVTMRTEKSWLHYCIVETEAECRVRLRCTRPSCREQATIRLVFWASPSVIIVQYCGADVCVVLAFRYFGRK
jgi:hypothetical protein